MNAKPHIEPVNATLPFEDALKRRWGVIVVGAGPAGALAAHQLARRGIAVLLVDRAAFPRGKVCGCCLNGRALAILRHAGLEDSIDGAVPLDAMSLVSRGQKATIRMRGGGVLSRESFDAALVSAAIVAGAHFLPETAAELVRGDANEWRQLRLRHGQAEADFRSRLVLAADGLGSQLMARGGIGRAPAELGARVGVGAVAVQSPECYQAGTVYMTSSEFGYLGIVRLEDNRLDLAAALEPTRLRRAGGPGPIVARMIVEAGWDVPALPPHSWRGTVPLTRRLTSRADTRILALGDAAGFVEPFTGEGMAWALAGAAAVAPLAARAVSMWRPAIIDEWNATYRHVVARRQSACRIAVALLRRPRLAAAAVGLLAYFPALASPLLNALNAE